MKKFLLSLAVLAAGALSLGAQETLTVADGTNTSSTVPFNMMYWDEQGTTTQVIYSESMLADMVGGQITSIKFYPNSGSFTHVDGTAQISVGTTDQTVFESATAITGLTVVNSAFTCPETGVSEVEVVFDAPFAYNGGNLVFECVLTESTGSWKSNPFFGVNTSDKVSFSRSTTYAFMPKTTFAYDIELPEYNAFVTPQQLDFGKVAINGTKEMTITLKNKGTNAFTPAVSGLEAPFSSEFTGAELASKETVEIPVTFSPTDYNDYTGTMTIDCGEAGTFQVALIGSCVDEHELTVCDGTNQSQIAPIHGYYGDTQGAFVQMLYPASMLTDLVGKKITEIRFYSSQAITMSSQPTYELSLAETEETAYICESAISAPTNLVAELTKVATTQLTNGMTELVFEFDTPFVYEGGNLAVQTYNAIKGGWQRTYFYGTPQEAITAYSQWSTASGSNQNESFLPKMTVVYTSAGEQPVEPEMNEFYLVGTFNDWNQTEEGGRIAFAENEDGEFVAEVEFEAEAEFKVITPAEEGWTWFGGQDDNQVGYFLINQDLYNADIALVDGANFRMAEAGSYTITLKEAATTGEKGLAAPIVMSVEKVQTAISTIATDNATDNSWYNLAGQRLSGKPSVPGIYINGGRKVIVK